VAELKSLVEAKTGIQSQYQQLIYIGKYMQDWQTLSHFDTLRSGSTIMLVMRLPGGSLVERKVDPSLPRSKERCMITCENFEENCVVVLQMPCNAVHAMCSDALMDYAWSEVSTNRKTEVKCPLCAEEWSLDVVKRYGGATSIELDQLELGISQNFCTKSDECPKCQSYCTRQNTRIDSVLCLVCSKKYNLDYYFCWQCLQDWKTALSNKACGNSNCNDGAKLAQLQSCGKVKVQFVDIKIFKLRACPKCGTIIELASGCKHMTCKVCNTEFCFVCLRMKDHGSWSCGSYNTKCAPAPVQTSIPRP
jgi:hypothetical protein